MMGPGLRSARERAPQTLWFEAIGIAVVALLYALAAGSSVQSSARLHEESAVLVTWPLIVALTGLGWFEATIADLALKLTHAAFVYLFHLGFDRLRRVQ
jgi:uncharacterized membrane protein